MQSKSEPRMLPRFGEPRVRNLARTEDERRLLGDDGSALQAEAHVVSSTDALHLRDSVLDSSAVPIPTPGQTRMPKIMKVRASFKDSGSPNTTLNFVQGIPNGVRPMNTLTQSKHCHKNTDQKQSHPATSGRTKSQALDLEIVKGNNVKPPAPVANGDDHDEVPLAKRRKTGSKKDVPGDVPTSSDGIDPITVDPWPVLSLSRESKGPSRTRSSQSQMVDLAKYSVNGHVREYQSVEATMKSDPPRVKKRARSNGCYEVGYAGKSERVAKSGVDSSPSRPIPLSDDESPELHDHPRVSQNMDEGREQNPISLRVFGDQLHSRQQSRETRVQSRHFAASATAAENDNKPRVVQLPGSPKLVLQSEEPRLNDQFITVEGKRRNARYSLSPDELATSPSLQTSQLSAALHAKHTRKPSRSTSPVKSSSSTRKGSPVKGEVGDLAPSNVPRTNFKHTAAKIAVSKASTREDRTSRESEAEWGIVLATVNAGGGLLTSSDLGLQFDSNTASYIIIKGGQNLATKDSSLRIQPRKLLRAMWSMSGAKIRFYSSKIENLSNVLDITLRSEKDCQELLRRLQLMNTNLKVEPNTENQLDRMFEKRLSEHRHVQTFRSNRAVDEGEDILLATQNKANREPSWDQAQREEPAGTKKRRLMGSSEQIKMGKDEAEVLRSKPLKSSSRLSIRESKEILERGTSPSRISEITRVLQPRKQASTLTRTSAARGDRSSETSVSLDTDMRTNKPARNHDLGEPWRKPLIYPKIGKKKATVEWTDLERLDEGEFFNDTLISFYLRFLECQLEERHPAMAGRFHFFNSFFYASLTKTQRGKKGINYNAVRTWTRGVDIFTKDFVVVPINESLHWYLAVICNLPAVSRDLSSLEGDDHSSPSFDTARMKRDEHVNTPDRLPPEPPSPPGDGAVPQSSHPIVDIVNSTEEDARSSFAELSLDQQDKAHDQIMLDAQFGSNRIKASEVLDEELEAPTGGQETVAAVDAVSSTVAPSSSRKRKRKPMSSGKKLDSTEPAIITFDSLAVAHSPTVRVLKDYLKEEAHDKRSMAFDDSQIKGMTAVGIPKQDNYCDCGPYLLGYMDQFLEDPKDFMVKIMQKQLDSEKDWPQLDPSKLRSSMRDLILDLHSQQQDDRKVGAKKGGKMKTPQSTEPAPSLGLPYNRKQDGTIIAAGTTLTRPPIDEDVPNPSHISGTKAEALQNASMIDADVKAESMDPHTKTNRWPPTQDQGESIAPVDSQMLEDQMSDQPGLGPSSKAPKAEESSITLPSTIQDSQPPEAFQSLEDLPNETTGSLELHSEHLPSTSAATSTASPGTTYSPPLGQELLRRSRQEAETPS